jgi:hypothetical protein
MAHDTVPMLYVSLIFESLRAHPRIMFWTAVLSQALLWTLLPVLFYASPPGDLPITLAIGHEFQLGTDRGPPLAFWLAEIAYTNGGMPGVYVLAQACVVGALWAVFALGRATVGISQAVLAILLMVGVGAFSVPTPEFGPALLAAPIWALILLHYWRALGEGRSSYWILLGLETGLLLLTTSLGWVLFALLGLFTAATARGRAALRSPDPWICAAVALLIGLPYLAWLGNTAEIWKPALVRLRHIDPGQSAMEWLGILRDLSVAHAGVIVFVLLAGGWGLARRERMPTVDRPPMPPLAKPMIYFFAIAPALVATLVVVLLGRPWSLAAAAPLVVCSGLAVIVAAGDSITVYRQRLLSMAWIGLLVGPPAAMAVALLVLPWTLAIDFKVLHPADEIGRFFTAGFERRIGQPLAIVAGDPRFAALVALEPNSRPSLLMNQTPEVGPWVTAAEARAKGAVIVWPATDTPGTPPPAVRASFPDLIVEVPRVFERRIQGRLPLLRIGWAVLRPQTILPPPLPPQ